MRLLTQIDDRKVVISEHGYFETGAQRIAFEDMPGLDYVDFNGWCSTARGRVIEWDSRAIRERIRRFMRGER